VVLELRTGLIAHCNLGYFHLEQFLRFIPMISQHNKNKSHRDDLKVRSRLLGLCIKKDIFFLFVHKRKVSTQLLHTKLLDPGFAI
jgi:hypothetical protein